MRTFILVLSLLVVGLFSAGCEPRGETESLDTVFTHSKERFADAKKRSSLPQEPESEMVSRLAELEQILATIVGGENRPTSESFNAVLAHLSWLVDRAGYTSRPAFGELMSQYRALAKSQLQDGDRAQVVLLTARTYSLLAQELETTSFRVPRA